MSKKMIPLAAAAAGLAVLLSGPALASAQPAYAECQMGWSTATSTWGWVIDRRYTVDMLHNSRKDNNPARLGADLDKLLVRAKATHKKAEACDPKVTDRVKLHKLANRKSKAEFHRKRALAHAKDLHVHIAFAQEANAMRAKIQASDGTHYDELFAKTKAFDARVRAAAKTNRQLSSGWHTRIFNAIGRDLANEGKRAGVLKSAAERKLLLAGAVVTRMPQFKEEDSFDPAKVAEAFKTAPLNDFVVLLKGDNRYAPGPQNHYERVGNRGGIKTAAYVDVNPRAVYAIYNKAPGAPPEFTPGLLWSSNAKGAAIFVAMDGGRYRTYLSRIARGLYTSEHWLTAPVHTVLLERDVEYLGEQGVLPAKLVKRFMKADKGYSACTAKIWKRNERKFDRIRAKNLLRHVRKERINQLDAKVHRTIGSSCKKHRRAYEKTWAKSLKIYAAKRQAVFEVAHERMSAVAAKHAAKAAAKKTGK